MLSTQLKITHPTKGPLELGRWSKQELGNLIINLDMDRNNMYKHFQDYVLRYGFHAE